MRVAAPAGPFEREKFDRGVEILHAWGLVPRWRTDVFDTRGYLAGEDERRAEEWREAVSDPDCAAVFAARGGYGSIRLFERFPASVFVGDPRLLIGFSDVSILLWEFHRRGGWASLHGPMPAGEQFSAMDEVREAWYRRLLFDASPPGPAPLGELRAVRSGSVEGMLMPANLTLLVHWLATGRAVPPGAILVVEDVNEPAYRLDRMLATLRMAGVFQRAAGVVFGDFDGVDSQAVAALADDVLADFGGPCVVGATVGHGVVNTSLPLGVAARLDADALRLDILESPVC